MTQVQERLLESKMTEIEQARSWSPRVISKFETLIRGGDDLSLYRVNPLAFARDRAIAEAESIDLFLHATRSGLFDMSWDVVCPQSGMVLDSFGALRTLKTHYVCGLCDVTATPISTTSSRSPSRCRRSCGGCHSTIPTSLSVEDFHWKLRFLGDGRLPGQQVRFSTSCRDWFAAFRSCRRARPPRCAPSSVLARWRVSMSRRRPHLRCRSRASPRQRRRICGSATTGSASRRRCPLCRPVPSSSRSRTPAPRAARCC